MEREPQPIPEQEDPLTPALARAIVKTLITLDEVEPVEVRRGGELWAATFEVKGEDVDRVANDIGPTEPVAMSLDVYRDDVVGYWIASGEGLVVSEVFRFPSLDAMALAISQVAFYMEGGSDEAS